MGEEVKGKEEQEEKMEKLEKMENGGAPPSPAIKYYGWKAMPYIIGTLHCSFFFPCKLSVFLSLLPFFSGFVA